MNDIISFFQIDSGEIGIVSERLFEIGGLQITGPMITSSFILILFLVITLFLNLFFIKKEGNPTKVQVFLEITYEGVKDFTARITGDTAIAKKIMPVILAVFLYILFSNTISILLPLVGAIEYDNNPIFVTSTSDLNTTFGISAVVILWTHWMSIKKNNPVRHFLKFFKINSLVNGIKKGPAGLALGVVEFFVGLLDIISEFAKSLSLSLRLFGNMFAGEVLAKLLVGAIAIVFPVFLMLFGIFTGVLQALVFAALSASYFGAALKEEN